MTIPTYLEPITELDAVNEMLATIGATPVTTLDTATSVDAAVARNTLRSMNRNVQARGWHFNEEKGYTLTPTIADGYLVVPANTMRVRTVQTSAHLDLVQRATRLYDRVDHTDVFTDPVLVDLVLLLPYEEIPQAARTYIYIAASRQFADRMLGGQQNVHAFALQDEMRALSLLKNSDARTGKWNILSGSTSVSRILSRNGYYHGV